MRKSRAVLALLLFGAATVMAVVSFSSDRHHDATSSFPNMPGGGQIRSDTRSRLRDEYRAMFPHVSESVRSPEFDGDDLRTD